MLIDGGDREYSSFVVSYLQNAGVQEYWIVDPDKKRVLIYDFESDDFVKVYTFEDKVPVGIFNGQCEVDFAEIYDYIRFL